MKRCKEINKDMETGEVIFEKTAIKTNNAQSHESKATKNALFANRQLAPSLCQFYDTMTRRETLRRNQIKPDRYSSLSF